MCVGWQDRFPPASFQITVILVRVMAKAIQLFQPGFNYPQRLPRGYKIFVPDLAQSREQIIDRFGVVNKRRKRPIAQDELANRLAPRDPALMMFQVSEKCLEIIIGGGHIRDAIAGEQTPPPMADRFGDMRNDPRIIGVLLGFTR